MKLICLFLVLASAARPEELRDWRNITTGSVIPDEGYSDQPYVVITKDGNWLCVMTTGKGVEGEGGQHTVATISQDKGKTWSSLIDIEPADGPEASWIMPLIVPSGRVYAFYTYNADNLRELPNTNNPRIAKRVDTLGKYMFKYSDDNGRTWSKDRYDIPMRLMQIDRTNNTEGKVLTFWGVGKPVTWKNSAIFGFAKVGKWGNPGTMVESQGVFMRSDNILTERDPARIRWMLLPDGDSGLRAPKGPVSDEANLVPLNDGGLYATYRTIDGYNCQAYSKDGGHTWTPPDYASYSPGGRRIKHSRAANFVKKFSNGKYLLWYHNHGGEAVHTIDDWQYYSNRNPAWITGGVERNGKIYWSEPEILLYDDNPAVRMSYPDFIEEKGNFYVTETQKTVARVHEIDRTLLDGLWNQSENRGLAPGGVSLSAEMPKLPLTAERRGFSIDFWMKLRELSSGQTILDARDASGKGIAITTSKHFTLQLTMNDGSRTATWDSDPGTHPGTLKIGQWQHVALIVDAGPKVILWVVDGVLNDGGAVRDFGFGRFPKDFGDINGAAQARIAPVVHGEVKGLRYYGRALRVSEAVGNFRAGQGVR